MGQFTLLGPVLKVQIRYLVSSIFASGCTCSLALLCTPILYFVFYILFNSFSLHQIENEENVLVCLRIIIELHKQFRPPLQSEVQFSNVKQLLHNHEHIKYHFIISSHLTMYFPVEQCFIIIIKFVKNIFVVNYYFRSYSFTTERTEGKKLQ